MLGSLGDGLVINSFSMVVLFFLKCKLLLHIFKNFPVILKIYKLVNSFPEYMMQVGTINRKENHWETGD